MNKVKTDGFLKICMCITAAAVTVTGIAFRQPVVRILPLYISMFITLLHSRVNRYAHLIGAFNAVFYGIIYITLHQYGTAAYCILVSAVMSFYTFFCWGRNSWGNATVFRHLSRKQRILIGFLAAIGGIILFGFKQDKSMTGILDSYVTIVGLCSGLFMIFSYAEYAYMMIGSYVMLFLLNIWLLPDVPGQVTYLIFYAYGFMGSCITCFRVKKICEEQAKEKGGEFSNESGNE